MSLVSGSYDDSESDEETVPQETPVNTDTKRKAEDSQSSTTDNKPTTTTTPTNKKQKQQEDSEIPDLPDLFGMKVPFAKSNTSTSPASTKSNSNTKTEKEEGASALLPPQLRKKQPNIVTEDTAAWSSAKGAKKSKPKNED